MDANLADNYFGLLKNLSSDMKLELITRLSNSMKSSKKSKDKSLKSLYGAFISDQTADEMIEELKQSRAL